MDLLAVLRLTAALAARAPVGRHAAAFEASCRPRRDRGSAAEPTDHPADSNPRSSRTCAAGVALVIAGAPGVAWANAGIPPLSYSLTVTVLLLIPVIAIEAVVLRRALALSVLRAVTLTTVANVLSTLAGIMVVFASFFVPLMVTRGARADLLTLLGFVPLFFVSWWVEAGFARWRLRDRAATDVRRAVSRANLASYGVLALLVTVRLVGHLAGWPCVSPLLQDCYPTAVEAMREGNFAEANRLIRPGPELNLRGGPFGDTALHVAARHGAVESVRLLLESGADVHPRNGFGETPLLSAASARENHRIVKLLLDHGAAVGDRDRRGRTTLHWAAYHGDALSVAVLLEKGADVGAVDEKGYTALHDQATGRNGEVARQLIRKGADVNMRSARGDTPLHLAAYISDNGAAVRLLLEAGADASAKGARGLTPLDLATRAELSDEAKPRFAEAVKALIEHGAAKSSGNR